MVFATALEDTFKRYDEMALIRTAPAAEDKFITVNSLRKRQLTAPEIRAHIKASQSSRPLNINCSEETA